MTGLNAGSIEIGSPDIRINQAMMLDDFLSSPLSPLSKPLVHNPPWSSYAIGPISTLGDSFFVSLFFQSGRLYSVHLKLNRPELGESWSDWTELKELNRKQLHEQILQKMLGYPPSILQRRTADDRLSVYGYEFPWGKIESCYDPRSGSSCIVVAYSSNRDSQ